MLTDSVHEEEWTERKAQDVALNGDKAALPLARPSLNVRL